MVPELPSPPQRARPFHSHSIQTQASPFHLSRSVIRSITLFFFGWDICSSLSSSFGVLTACSAESLVPSSLSSLAQVPILTHFTATGFLIHSSCTCLDSWKFIIEVHWTVRAPLVFVRYRACFLGGQVLGDFPGLCKTLHETTLLLVSYGTTWDFRRAYLSFLFLSWFYFMWVGGG